MIDPLSLHLKPPPFYGRPQMHKREGVWAQTEGLLHPRVVLDPLAKAHDGYEALVVHESVHAVEYHLFAAFLLFVSALTAVGAGLVSAGQGEVGGGLVLLSCGALFTLAWACWRREMEARADAVALYGAGEREFTAFLLLVAHPSHAWGRWLYSRSRQARYDRALRRCLRRGWRPLP